MNLRHICCKFSRPERVNAFPLEDAEIRRKQQFYAESILALGEGRDHPHAIVLDTLENGS